MGKGFLWTIVALSIAILNVLQLSEAKCGDPLKNCENDGECKGQEACLAMDAGYQKKCHVCRCRDKSRCELQPKDEVTGLNYKCNCPQGLKGDHCECEDKEENNEIPFEYDCPEFSSEYFVIRNAFFTGDRVAKVKAVDLEDCQRICTEDPNCFILYFGFSSKDCILFHYRELDYFTHFTRIPAYTGYASIRKCKSKSPPF